MYSLEGRSIKRETHLKEEKIPEIGVDKGKDVKKAKEQENGLAV